ncbi:MAG: DUF5668 domain-containing protein [Chloroflexota bacterium]
MVVHRGYLFWGIFFVLLGGIPLLDRLGVIDAAAWGDLWRLWPLIIIAIGLAILIGRSRMAVAGTVVTALVIGAIAGGSLAAGSGIINFGDCLPGGESEMQRTTDSGQLADGASVELEVNCGELDVTAATGDAWSLVASYRGAAPEVNAGAGSLRIRAPGEHSNRQEWKVELPIERVRELTIGMNAGGASIDISNAQLDELSVETNAGDTTIVAEGARIDALNVDVNAGRARITLDGPVAEGDLSVNAGAIDLCLPDSAALRLTVEEQLTFATNLDEAGLVQDGETWTRQGSGPEIALHIEGNAASLTLNPEDGCR